jgi:hypothetical protein
MREKKNPVHRDERDERNPDRVFLCARPID